MLVFMHIYKNADSDDLESIDLMLLILSNPLKPTPFKTPRSILRRFLGIFEKPLNSGRCPLMGSVSVALDADTLTCKTI